MGLTSYELKLLESIKIHPVFYLNLLRLNPNNLLLGQKEEPPPSVIIKNEDKYDVVRILNLRFYHEQL